MACNGHLHVKQPQEVSKKKTIIFGVACVNEYIVESSCRARAASRDIPNMLAVVKVDTLRNDDSQRQHIGLPTIF